VIRLHGTRLVGRHRPMPRSLCAGAGVLRASILWTLMYLLGNAPRAGGYNVLTNAFVLVGPAHLNCCIPPQACGVP
jgi:hypothetical protein